MSNEAPSPGKQAPTPIRLDSAKLLAGRKEVTIVHKGVEYRLRLTNNDKLILIK